MQDIEELKQNNNELKQRFDDIERHFQPTENEELKVLKEVHEFEVKFLNDNIERLKQQIA